MQPILFLDIDGVLNDHTKYASGCTTILPRCVEQLNWLIRTTGCGLVITSAWRHMIVEGTMNPKGFGYLLRTHGLSSAEAVIGSTERDRPGLSRNQQVLNWLRGNGANRSWCVVDDLDLGFSACPQCCSKFVHTDPAVGLTAQKATEIVGILKQQLKA